MTYQKTINIRDLIIEKYHSTFNDKKHTHQIYTSGRAGTKSSRGGIKAIYKAIEKPCAIVCMRKNHNKLRKTIYKECVRAIKRLGLDKSDFDITVSPMQIRYKETGSTIYFAGSDSIDDTKGLIDENFPIELVIVDEVNEFFEKGEGEDELVNIEATFIRGNDSDFVMEYYFNPPKNPKAPVMQWLDKMKLRKDCIHVHVDYRDVPVEWLGKKLIESALEMLRLDEKMYNWLWLGLCTGLEDLIYYMFDEEKHIKDDNDEDYDLIGVGIDYGQMNPTTFEAFGLSFKKKKIKGIDEYYHSGRESGKQKSPSEYAKDFKTFVESIEKQTGKRVLFTVIDPSAKGLKEELRRVVPNMKYIDADNTVKLGISRLQKLLSYNVIEISKKQTHLKDEFYLYEYDENSIEKGDEKPKKENDHCLDAVRYLIMAFWKHIVRLFPNLKDKEGDSND